MNLYLRLFALLICNWFLPKRSLAPLGTSKLRFTVLPNDLDPYGHMNNGRYLTLMDLGRIDVMLKTGLWHTMKERGWNPLVGSSYMIHRRPLLPFQRFTLLSRVATWDDKWLYMEHRFERDGVLYAFGFVRALLRGHEGNIPSETVVHAIDPALVRPALGAAIEHWILSQKVQLDALK